MSNIESSPSVRRSNSYRVALRKSGVPKEYIEELMRMQAEAAPASTDTQSAAPAIENNNSNNEQKPKKLQFKRNYRGVGKKFNANSNEVDQNEQQEKAIFSDSVDQQHATAEEKEQMMMMMNNTGDANNDETPTPAFQRMFCLFLCCNNCAILPKSFRSKLSFRS